ncbi:YitT family protein [Noviherbaspirillum massiliense]|uniref:YitT family protein n=1 Tax=Noviherbaspirillum massiliense TaxID=1465823 RepID=UPI00068828F4|nr:YitT family protein [Noviherbaspirillum massiliense]
MSSNPEVLVQERSVPATQRHTLLEDLQAIVAGTMLMSLGVTLFGKAGLITGGVVGLGFLLHYATGIGFGKLFFIINLPFYILAFRKMGWQFVLKTFSAVLLLSIFSELMPLVLRIESLTPLYAAAMGGLLTGVALLVLFRHKASLGGFNILVLYLQERFGWRVGLVQLVLDSMILLLSTLTIPFSAVAISLAGAAVLNLTLAINHRPGRYIAM